MAKKKKKPIAGYLSTTLMMYVYSLIFAIASVVFLIDKIPNWVQIGIGILFSVPIYMLFFLSGKREGEDLYRSVSKSTLAQVHDRAPIKVPAYRCVFHTLGYALPLILLAIIAAATKNAVVRGILAFIMMPVTLVYLGAGVFTYDAVTANVLYIYIPVIVFGCLVYAAGYMKSILIMKKRQGEIETELRSFDN